MRRPRSPSRAIALRISCAFAQPISSERTRSTTAARRVSRSATASSESSDASGRGGCEVRRANSGGSALSTYAPSMSTTSTLPCSITGPRG